MIRIATPLNLVLAGAMVLVALAGLLLIPAGTQLPVHWNFAGEADLFVPRELALLLPLALTALLWGILAYIRRIASPADIAAGAHAGAVVITAVTTLFLGLAVAIVLIGLGAEVSMVQVVAVGIGVLLIVLGNAMPKSQPNSFAGLRIPTTLNDPANWQATHRLTGLLCIAGGAVLLIAAWLAPPARLLIWLLACVFVPILTGTAYSLLRNRQRA